MGAELQPKQATRFVEKYGFSSPSWQDLSYVLIGIMVVASLIGAAWTLYSRSQHDPWLRLLQRARKHLALAGMHSDDSTPARDLAQRAQAHWGPAAQSLHDWLLQLEAHRYAPPHARANTLATLRTQFSQLPGLVKLPSKTSA